MKYTATATGNESGGLGPVHTTTERQRAGGAAPLAFTERSVVQLGSTWHGAGRRRGGRRACAAAPAWPTRNEIAGWGEGCGAAAPAAGRPADTTALRSCLLPAPSPGGKAERGQAGGGRTGG